MRASRTSPAAYGGWSPGSPPVEMARFTCSWPPFRTRQPDTAVALHTRNLQPAAAGQWRRWRPARGPPARPAAAAPARDVAPSSAWLLMTVRRRLRKSEMPLPWRHKPMSRQPSPASAVGWTIRGCGAIGKAPAQLCRLRAGGLATLRESPGRRVRTGAASPPLLRSSASRDALTTRTPSAPRSTAGM